MEFRLNTIVSRKKECKIVDTNEGLIIIPLEGDTLLLNSSSIFIWELLKKENKVEYLLNSFLEEYDITKIIAKKNIIDLLKLLYKQSLLNIV